MRHGISPSDSNDGVIHWVKVTARRSIYTEVENKAVGILLTLRIEALGKPETVDSTPNRVPEPRSSFQVPSRRSLLIPGHGTQP